MNRIETGIKGFDDLVEGGFPEKSAVLLLGTYGTGKSIFGLEYIYNGALNHGDVGVYISFEQTPETLRNQAKQMGYEEFENLENEGKIVQVNIPTDMVDNNTEKVILDTIKEKGAKRVVVDSLSALSINAPVYLLAQKDLYTHYETDKKIIHSAINYDDLKKNFIYGFIRKLRETGATSLLISEIEDGVSVDKVSEYVSDGVVQLNFESMGGDYSRSLLVRKMRLTMNDENVAPVELSKQGIVVHRV